MRDYRPTNTTITGDIGKMLAQDPEAFDVTLYRAEHGTEEVVVTDSDVVGTMEGEERTLTYADPETIRAKFLPFENEYFPGGVESLGSVEEVEQPLVMLLSDQKVADQSVIQYDEYYSTSQQQTITLYVLKSETSGTAPAIVTRYFMIPFGDDLATLTR